MRRAFRLRQARRRGWRCAELPGISWPREPHSNVLPVDRSRFAALCCLFFVMAISNLPFAICHLSSLWLLAIGCRLPSDSPFHSMKTVTSLKTTDSNLQGLVDAALEQSGGLLRLAPCWVPRSFLQPGRRLKLHPDDLYAFGLDRGGIDERWFASTTPAANENRTPDEGLSYCVFGENRFTLATAIQECGTQLIGKAIWGKYQRWPVYSKFFDNMGPIPHHMHQIGQAGRAGGAGGKAGELLFSAAAQQRGQQFPLHLHGPGTRHDQRSGPQECLENWNKGDNGILDLSKAYRLKPGTGWLIGPCILHAPGSLCTYEPQWGRRCFRHVSIAGRRPRSAVVAPGQGHAERQASRPRFHRRATRLGSQRRPELQGQPLSRAGPGRGHGLGGVRRSLDRLRQDRRRATFHRQGTDDRTRREMHDQGQWRLRLNLRAGQRHDEPADARLPEADSLPRIDRG